MIPKIPFQSTLPRRERLCHSCHSAKTMAISIHAPAKGATGAQEEKAMQDRNFNPRSREGSDGANYGGFDNDNISIHAPAKGATSSSCLGVTLGVDFNPRSREGSDLTTHSTNPITRPISIHAPAKGATQVWTGCIYKEVFQSTLPRRERQVDIKSKIRAEWISIHAPAKGATATRPMPPSLLRFQSTLPRRERRC